MTIPPRLLQDWAKLFHGVDLAETRAAELAVEVERLDAAIRDAAAPRLRFDSEPGSLAAILDARAD